MTRVHHVVLGWHLKWCISHFNAHIKNISASDHLFNFYTVTVRYCQTLKFLTFLFYLKMLMFTWGCSYLYRVLCPLQEKQTFFNLIWEHNGKNKRGKYPFFIYFLVKICSTWHCFHGKEIKLKNLRAGLNPQQSDINSYYICDVNISVGQYDFTSVNIQIYKTME